MKKIFIFFTLSLLSNCIFAQTQVGEDLNGEAHFDRFGEKLCMPTSNIIAVGAHANDGSAENAGHVRVFKWNGFGWFQKGSDIDGENEGDRSGWSVSMPDPNFIAIGAINSENNGVNSGHVRVFEYVGSEWEQKGFDIDGDDQPASFGGAVSMPDENTVAIGATYHNNDGIQSGQVKVYQWNGILWIQKGGDLNGDAEFDLFGASVSMPDANTLAVGGWGNDNNGEMAGYVKIFNWDGTQWLQKGSDIEGESAGDLSGHQVSMPSPNVIAIGAFNNSDSGYWAGQARIFEWNGVEWMQKGMDIDGENAEDFFGYSVSMPDENTVAVGAWQNDENGSRSGQVRVFSWNDDAWIQMGININGETVEDLSGYSVCMPDAYNVAIGAPNNSDSLDVTGHVRVYTFGTPPNDTHVIESTFDNDIKFSPNPTQREVTIDFGTTYSDISVVLKNSLGQIVQTNNYEFSSRIEFFIEGESGVYFMEIKSEEQKAVLKIVKD